VVPHGKACGQVSPAGCSQPTGATDRSLQAQDATGSLETDARTAAGEAEPAAAWNEAEEQQGEEDLAPIQEELMAEHDRKSW
jgi:hypothetical protein